MKKFAKEFNTLRYIIKHSNKILLFAHNQPDSDTSGSCLALHDYLFKKNKIVDIACLDPFPKFLEAIAYNNFKHPDELELKSYDTVIAADSVERGFHKIKKTLSSKQIVVLLDHHPDISIQGDLNIIDSTYSSVCEIIYDYLIFAREDIGKDIATFLLLGILADTGNFKHANTTAKTMEIASELMKKGANITKIINATFANKKMSTLKLWGKAFERAIINPKNGMIATVITRKDMENAESIEDIGQIASILSSVPGTKFSLILSERENGIIKGSLRSEEYKGVDVSKIAALFGGGGHKLASGFEIRGKIIETKNGWEIV